MGENSAEPVAKRKRGRPKKSAVEPKSKKPLLARSQKSSQESKERKKGRGRGRPPKIPKSSEIEEEEDEELAEVLPKKKRGRPSIDKVKSGRPGWDAKDDLTSESEESLAEGS